jgi:hypothetical protein
VDLRIWFPVMQNVWQNPELWRWVTDNRLWFFKRVGGVFFTAAALAMGAPFWFDVLKKAANLRATGPVLEKAAADDAKG